jgi:hypothetical protein
MKRALTGLMGAAAIAAVALAPTAQASPSGTFLLVPRDVTAGTYFAQIQPGYNYGYFAVCGDYACDTDYGDNSVIHNGSMSLGRSEAIVMVIPTAAVAVKLTNATLTRM